MDRSQSLQLEINSLQEETEAVKAASASVVPPMPPPSFPFEGAPVVKADGPSGVQIQEIQEGDEEMEDVEEEDNGSGVGAFLAPPRKKMVKNTLLKKASAKNVSVKPETRSSVLAKEGMLNARELTRLIAECSELAKQKEDEEQAEGVPRPELGATVEDNKQVSFVWVAISDVRAKETMKTFFFIPRVVQVRQVSGRLLSKIGSHCTKLWIFRFWRPGFSFLLFGVF